MILGLTEENPMVQALRFLFWGQGETGILVYQILRRHWSRCADDDVRPTIYLMSEQPG